MNIVVGYGLVEDSDLVVCEWGWMGIDDVGE